ncbi:MAG: efflux RND transporter periplasmic adaptor subunit [Paludibacteraceae bacterium]
MKEQNKDLRLGLIGLVIVLILVFIIGLVIYKPEPEIIQGEAEASVLRVSGKVPARIARFTAQEGDMVQAGDTLVFLDSPELSAKMEQATAAELAASAQSQKAQKGARKELIQGAYEMWQKAKVGEDIAKKSFDRVQNLFNKGVIPAQKRDEAEAQYNAAVATTRAAKSQYDMAMNGAEAEDKLAANALVMRAKGAVDEVKSYLKEITLTAPISGQIEEIYPERGELVGTGAPIMSIIDLNDIWFTFNVREDLLGSMKEGTVVKVKIPALENKVVEAKIFNMKALASYATWRSTKTSGQIDVKTFEVKARPMNKVENLLPGMTSVVVK